MIRLDVDYALDRSHGWFPCAWTYTTYRHPEAGQTVGDVFMRDKARVTGHSFNVKIPDSEFRIDSYPPGTLVSDVRAHEYYILREGGRKRMITEQEVSAACTYDELVATESGMAVPGAFAPTRTPDELVPTESEPNDREPGAWRRMRWWALTAAIVLLIAGAALFQRRRMKQRAP